MPRRIWLLLHEPRVITAIQSLIWAVVGTVGVAVWMWPPQTIAHEIGPTLTAVWGSLLISGGTLGFVGCIPGWWWVERSGIAVAITGATIYAVVVAFMHHTQPGNRLAQLGFIIVTILYMVTRWYRVRGAQVDPARGLHRDHP